MKIGVLCLAFIASVTAADRVSAQVTQTYTYDGHGRLVGVTTSGSAGTNTATYAYDRANNRTQRVRSGTTSYAAVESVPNGGLLAPDEALTSPNGRYTFALRPSGQLELWRDDETIWSPTSTTAALDVTTTESGSSLALAAGPAAATAARWSVTDDGALVATTHDGLTTVWSSGVGSL